LLRYAANLVRAVCFPQRTFSAVCEVRMCGGSGKHTAPTRLAAKQQSTIPSPIPGFGFEAGRGQSHPIPFDVCSRPIRCGKQKADLVFVYIYLAQWQFYPRVSGCEASFLAKIRAAIFFNQDCVSHHFLPFGNLYGNQVLGTLKGRIDQDHRPHRSLQNRGSCYEKLIHNWLAIDD
jgi:hypothetical protein